MAASGAASGAAGSATAAAAAAAGGPVLVQQASGPVPVPAGGLAGAGSVPEPPGSDEEEDLDDGGADDCSDDGVGDEEGGGRRPAARRLRTAGGPKRRRRTAAAAEGEEKGGAGGKGDPLEEMEAEEHRQAALAGAGLWEQSSFLELKVRVKGGEGGLGGGEELGRGMVCTSGGFPCCRRVWYVRAPLTSGHAPASRASKPITAFPRPHPSGLKPCPTSRPLDRPTARLARPPSAAADRPRPRPSPCPKRRRRAKGTAAMWRQTLRRTPVSCVEKRESNSKTSQFTSLAYDWQ